jgi:hypothetical protein
MNTSKSMDEFLAVYPDWRGDLLKELCGLINDVGPNLKQEFKWGVPVWSQNGLVCAISAFKNHVKMNFFKGAFLDDPKGIFNSGQDSKEHRSINFSKDDKPNKEAVKELILSAISLNEK